MENMDYIAIPRDEYRELIAENVRMGITLDSLHDLIEREDIAYAKAMGDSRTFYESYKIKNCIHYVEANQIREQIDKYIEEYKAREVAKGRKAE